MREASASIKHKTALVRREEWVRRSAVLHTCRQDLDCYFSSSSASRSLVSFSNSSLCCAIRSALRASSPAPDEAAACSVSCRILSRKIAMRSLRSESCRRS